MGMADSRAGRLLPAWSGALAVIAHPDDESFGLGAVIDQLTAAGTAVHILCYSHGGASTLNETRPIFTVSGRRNCGRRALSSGRLA